MRGDHVEARRLADDGKVRFQSAGNQCAGTRLRILLVHHAGEYDFGFPGPSTRSRDRAKRFEHRRHGTLRVAGAPAEKPSIFLARSELRGFGIDGIEMGHEQNPAPNLARRQKSREQIGAVRQDFLQFHLQPGFRGDGRKEFRHAPFAGAAVIRRQKRRIHARQRDQFAQ